MSASEMMMLEEELDELRAEVERLRKECGQAYLQGVKAGREAERIAERGATVVWLRASRSQRWARDIERGEHRKEEKE
jgi:hypothetical protein